jgi:hypothetical protein
VETHNHIGETDMPRETIIEFAKGQLGTDASPLKDKDEHWHAVGQGFMRMVEAAIGITRGGELELAEKVWALALEASEASKRLRPKHTMGKPSVARADYCERSPV